MMLSRLMCPKYLSLSVSFPRMLAVVASMDLVCIRNSKQPPGFLLNHDFEASSTGLPRSHGSWLLCLSVLARRVAAELYSPPSLYRGLKSTLDTLPSSGLFLVGAAIWKSLKLRHVPLAACLRRWAPEVRTLGDRLGLNSRITTTSSPMSPPRRCNQLQLSHRR